MRRFASFLKSIFVLTGFFCLMAARAQKSYFIYIQSETKIPYTVQIGDKVFQSNNTGYLLIPSLEPREYTLIVSFPKNQYANQTFLCDISEKGRGFFLKQDTESTLVLSDMVTRAVIHNAVGKEVSKINYDNKLQKELVDSLSKNKFGERIKITNPHLGNGTSVIYKPSAAAPATGTSVTKTYEKVGVNGINQAFSVLNGSKLDTVLIFIPALEDSRENPVPVKKRSKIEKNEPPAEKNPVKEQGEDATLSVPAPTNGAIPKKAKSFNN